MHSSVPDANTTCPRCGYDMRGVVASWHEQCDLSGTCTECALEFNWAEVLNPGYRQPTWCCEFGSRMRCLVRICQTTSMVFRPWRFWDDLQMTHPMRWKRIAVLLAFQLAGLYILFCLLHGVLVATEWSNATLKDVIAAMVLPWNDTHGPSSPNWYWRSSRDCLNDITLPLLQRLDNQVLGPVVILASLLCPLMFVSLPVSRRIAKVRWRHILRIGAYGITLLTIPTGIALLITLVTAILRWQDLAVLDFLFFMLRDALRAIAPFSSHMIIAFMVVWWSLATGRHLKMRHQWGVGLAVVAMAILIAALIGTVIVFIYYWSRLESGI